LAPGAAPAARGGGGRVSGRKRQTQKAALQEARDLIDSNKLDVPFCCADLKRLSDLSGTELRYAVRRANPQFPNDARHLHVLAYDWTTPDQWSWLHAIKIAHARDPHEAHKARLRGKQLCALRYAVQRDLDDFRSAVWPQECALCGGSADLTTDHVAPCFVEIACNFLELHGPIELRRVRGCGDLIADAGLLAEWITYHARRAVYQLLCRSCNARKGICS
jgi:hypothetical protein